MKRISVLALWILLTFSGGAAYSQDTALIEERVKQLKGLVDDLIEDKAHLKKQVESLSKEVQALREQQSQPNSSYASQDDLRKLAETVQKIDEQRKKDDERILSEVEKAIDKLKPSSGAVGTRPKPPKDEGMKTGTGGSEKGFEHVIQSGDNLSAIVAAYREKGIKVSVDEILKANPGLKANSLPVGKKIFIPGPQ